MKYLLLGMLSFKPFPSELLIHGHCHYWADWMVHVEPDQDAVELARHAVEAQTWSDAAVGQPEFDVMAPPAVGSHSTKDAAHSLGSAHTR